MTSLPQFASYPSLKGRAVLVTGGASGIGADLVAQFAAQGARVAFLDVDEDAARRTAASAAAPGQPPMAFRVCDLQDINTAVAAADALAREIGPFSVLVNNAGDDSRHEVLDVTPDQWDRQMNVNLRPQFFLAQAMVQRLPQGSRGSIVNLGSISWMKGAHNIIVYATAKSAVVGLTKAMSREFGGRGVRVNAIAPGWIATDKQLDRAERTAAGSFAASVAAQAIPEPLVPGDVSRLALWLAADDSVHCTGQTIVVDGGLV